MSSKGTVHDYLGLRDRRVAMKGGAKTRRVDLGLELLMNVALYGVALTQDEVAAWCGCTRGNVYEMEKRALKKVRNLLKFGNRRAMGKEITT